MIHPKKQEQNTLSAGVIDLEIKMKRLQWRNVSVEDQFINTASHDSSL